jgi:hypothetical protein
MPKKVTLESLAEQMERGFGAIAGDIGRIEQAMATKDDVRTIVREETADIRTELTDIRRDLTDVRAKVDNLTGVTKEIDHALARIRRIEKHLGIEADIAA